MRGQKQTFGSLLKLVAAFLLPPLPGFEDLAERGELALALGKRGAVLHASPLPSRRTLLLFNFIL